MVNRKKSGSEASPLEMRRFVAEYVTEFPKASVKDVQEAWNASDNKGVLDSKRIDTVREAIVAKLDNYFMLEAFCPKARLARATKRRKKREQHEAERLKSKAEFPKGSTATSAQLSRAFDKDFEQVLGNSIKSSAIKGQTGKAFKIIEQLPGKTEYQTQKLDMLSVPVKQALDEVQDVLISVAEDLDFKVAQLSERAAEGEKGECLIEANDFLSDAASPITLPDVIAVSRVHWEPKSIGRGQRKQLAWVCEQMQVIIKHVEESLLPTLQSLNQVLPALVAPGIAETVNKKLNGDVLPAVLLFLDTLNERVEAISEAEELL
jgi:hypothetical protein